MVAKRDMAVRRAAIGMRIQIHGTMVLRSRMAEEQALKNPVGA